MVLFSVEAEVACVITKLVVLIHLNRPFKAWVKITWRSVSTWQVCVLVSKMWAVSGSSELKLDCRTGRCAKGHGLNMPTVSSTPSTPYPAIPYFFRLRNFSLPFYWIIVWLGTFWTSCTVFFIVQTFSRTFSTGGSRSGFQVSLNFFFFFFFYLIVLICRRRCKVCKG